MYYKGEGMPKDLALALVWWKKAAAQGDAQAQTNLGLMYYNGEGMPQDLGKVEEWWRKAAAQGVTEAQTNLNMLYELKQISPAKNPR